MLIMLNWKRKLAESGENLLAVEKNQTNLIWFTDRMQRRRSIVAMESKSSQPFTAPRPNTLPRVMTLTQARKNKEGQTM
jgi:hypothetical protein